MLIHETVQTERVDSKGTCRHLKVSVPSNLYAPRRNNVNPTKGAVSEPSKRQVS